MQLEKKPCMSSGFQSIANNFHTSWIAFRPINFKIKFPKQFHYFRYFGKFNTYIIKYTYLTAEDNEPKVMERYLINKNIIPDQN